MTYLHSFKVKLKVFLFEIEHINQVVICKIRSILTTIRKVSKRIIFNSRLILSSDFIISASILPLPMPKIEINQFPGKNQSQIETLISKSSLQLPYINMRSDSIDRIKLVVPENSNRLAFSSNLFGQSHKIRCGKVDELQKLVFRASYSTLIKQAYKHPELLKPTVNYLVSSNQIILNSVIGNLGKEIFKNADVEVFQSLANQVFQLVLSQIPNTYKYLHQRNPLSFPVADAFRPNLPCREGIPPSRNNFELEAQPKLTKIEMEAILNRPADVAKAKQEITSAIFDRHGISKEAQKTLENLTRREEVNHLIDQIHLGNKNPGTGTKAVPGTYLFESRTKNGTRVMWLKKDNIIYIVAICTKDNEKKVFTLLRKDYSR